ncbi:MAG: VOC family protein [Bacteroidota bacterium]|nr:VOC family protein [Bacteroidota bacterium]
MVHSIYPCFWFDGQSKSAAEFYCSLFSNSRIISESSLVVMFELEGKKIMALNGGPMYKINPSISLFVTCVSDDEIEKLYTKLSENGSALMQLDKYPWSEKYAWIKDKFGVTWQLMLEELPKGKQKITPAFLFANQQYGKAKEAIEFYTSLFPNSFKDSLQLYLAGEVQPEGNLKFGNFTLTNQQFCAMDGPGNHNFNFNEAVSLVVNCDTQEEIDFYWNSLTKDGKESMCGWLVDKYGISWQIVPSFLGQLMSDPEKGQKVIQAFVKMKKFDIETLLHV